VVIQGTRDFNGMVRNIAISLSLYSGQMCTTPQNLYVPGEGIRTPEGLRTPEEFRQALAAALGNLTSDPSRAVELLGAVQSAATLQRLEEAVAAGTPVAASRVLEHPGLPAARLRTPLVMQADVESDAVATEQFGPISFVIELPTAHEALLDAERAVREKGAISWSVYAWDEDFVAAAKAAAARAGAHLSLDMTGPMLVNQSAAFSDFHVSGRNPAGNASLTDAAFVLPRFSVLQTRRYLP